MEGDMMKVSLTEARRKNKNNIYTFCSAKKIFFMRTTSKALLLEKMAESRIKVISLIPFNPIVTSKNNEMILFPRNK